MTALKEFARLECEGLWRSSDQGQRRDVVVSFGDATLVISDSHGRALTHWSLPAVQRLNPGKTPALFSPDGSEAETLELSDADMTAAIDQVQSTIARRKPKPGRLRMIALATSVVSVSALAIFWLPDALVGYATRILPDVKRLELDQALSREITRLTGQPCRGAFGLAALGRMKARLNLPLDMQLTVQDTGRARAIVLPGGTAVLDRRLVEDSETAEVTAGYLLAAQAQAATYDPLHLLLKHAGPMNAVRLLTSGKLAPDTLMGFSERLLLTNLPPASPEDMLARFETARLAASPYAYALDVTGESTLPLIEGDPMAGTQTPPVLTDGDWLSLQAICET